MNGKCEACRMGAEGLPDGNHAWGTTKFEPHWPCLVEKCVLCGDVKGIWWSP